MFSSFDVCLALDCVKKICENNRCLICDKESEEFLRYSCGHTACVSCASATDGCYSCLTSADQSTSNNKLDEVSGQRAVNASVLLKEFEKAFNVNVFNHQRMSEQLKLEKDIFPECIQAPRKYFNKRKSLNLNVKKKSNRISLLPGEVVSRDSNIMKNSITAVQKWLNRNKENVIENQIVNNKDENDESGIVIDASVVDSSQITADKDKQALLAVYEADKNEQSSASVLTIDSEEWEDNDTTVEHPKILKDEYKVPFFKKSKLTDSYVVCDNDTNINKSINNCGQNSKIEITISFDNQSIKPCEFVQKESLHTQSISVQTDICELSCLKDNLQDSPENSLLCSKLNVLSQDVFTPEELCKASNAKISNIALKTATKSVIINESDSDDGFVAEAAILKVSAQVHNIEHPVFSDITFIDSHEQLRREHRRRPRHLTPDSSNSSEKENLNPNKRQKKTKPIKKSKK